MNQNHYKFYSFMRATGGNWRNTLYVVYGGSFYPHGKNSPCEGCLMTADTDGNLIVMPVEIVRQFTDELIEPLECWETLVRKTLEAVFSRYIEWHTISNSNRSFLQPYQSADR